MSQGRPEPTKLMKSLSFACLSLTLVGAYQNHTFLIFFCLFVSVVLGDVFRKRFPEACGHIFSGLLDDFGPVFLRFVEDLGRAQFSERTTLCVVFYRVR